jgi:hypothetical protein
MSENKRLLNATVFLMKNLIATVLFLIAIVTIISLCLAFILWEMRVLDVFWLLFPLIIRVTFLISILATIYGLWWWD